VQAVLAGLALTILLIVFAVPAAYALARLRYPAKRASGCTVAQPWLSTPQTPQTQTGATPPPAAAPQTTGGQVMSQSPSGATSTLPTDKGTAGGNSGTSGGNSSGSKQ